MKAGAADDNLQFNAFVRFNEENAQLGLPLVVHDRIRLRAVDRNGLPVSMARVYVDGRLRRRTYADGQALLHPRRWGVGPQAEVVVEVAGARVSTSIAAAHGRELEVALDIDRDRGQTVPLDVAFVIDTTGSMGDELARLRDTLNAIVFQIGHMSPRPELRMGMVQYRDRGDAYVTQVVPFTSDIEDFETSLRAVAAGGGGDTPEDVQAGLRDAMEVLDWRGEGLQLGFLLGDAPPHLDYGQTYTYVDALETAGKKGIKLTTIGASGLDRQGELIWRQIAQATLAPFVFLTYGETGDSEGSPSSVSHHVGSNWAAADLDAIIVRMVKRELAHFDDRALPRRVDYFSAAHDPSRSSEDVLEELFERSTEQLVDYAVEPLEPGTPTVVLPLSAALSEVDPARSRLERRLALSLSRKEEFRLVETEMKEALLQQLAEQLSLAHASERARPRPGRIVPATLAVLGKVDQGATGRIEMLLELVRIETGEVVSLSLLEIDERLVL